MQRSCSDWADPDDGGEEEAVDRGAVAVPVGSGIRNGSVERYLLLVIKRKTNCERSKVGGARY
jgi:hypothetical protein